MKLSHRNVFIISKVLIMRRTVNLMLKHTLILDKNASLNSLAIINLKEGDVEARETVKKKQKSLLLMNLA